MIEKMGKSLIRLRHDESATAMIEYAILLGLISVAVIGLVIYVGGWVSSQWTDLSSGLATVP